MIFIVSLFRNVVFMSLASFLFIFSCSRSPTLDEETVLMRALRDMNAPKFVFEDVPLFLGLIDDLSPGLQVDRVTNEDLTRKIEKVLEEGKYQMLPKQVDKVLFMIQFDMICFLE